jgi:hypothetical protein
VKLLFFRILHEKNYECERATTEKQLVEVCCLVIFTVFVQVFWWIVAQKIVVVVGTFRSPCMPCSVTVSGRNKTQLPWKPIRLNLHFVTIWFIVQGSSRFNNVLTTRVAILACAPISRFSVTEHWLWSASAFAIPAGLVSVSPSIVKMACRHRASSPWAWNDE